MRFVAALLLVSFAVPALAEGARPAARADWVPRTAWENTPKGAVWTRAALAALNAHGRPLVETVPEDIDTWCPAYPNNDIKQRAAFWAGLLSVLARYESTWNPRAVGGGNRWFGLLQIAPATARGYKCRVGSGEALKSGAANVSCAIRIMATTVPRDGVVALKNGRSAGVGADWGPMTSRKKRESMAHYTSRQSYCRKLETVRPIARP